ncbi:hypothetical protein NL676_001745 [Syzygium grande]|nr:hypothetical protein NL676_001745 [Syzygium grande]
MGLSGGSVGRDRKRDSCFSPGSREWGPTIVGNGRLGSRHSEIPRRSALDQGVGGGPASSFCAPLFKTNRARNRSSRLELSPRKRSGAKRESKKTGDRGSEPEIVASRREQFRRWQIPRIFSLLYATMVPEWSRLGLQEMMLLEQYSLA